MNVWTATDSDFLPLQSTRPLQSLSLLNFWLDVSRASTGRNFTSCLSIKVVVLSWLLFPVYVGHRHRSQLCNSVSCAFCHPRQHLFHKNNIQLLALKWRLHHMPASHLVSARGAGAWLHLRRKQWRRANLSPPFFYAFLTCTSQFPSFLKTFSMLSILKDSILLWVWSISCSVVSAAPRSGRLLRAPVCASVHLLKVHWQHHLLNINAHPKQVFLQGLPRGLGVCMHLHVMITLW